MYVQSLLAIFCLLMGSYSQETGKQPEEDVANFEDQDLTKMLDVTGKHWVKRRTHEVTSPYGDPKCEYARIFGSADGAGEKTYTLVLGARFGKTWVTRNQTLVLTNSGGHPKPNVMKFVRNRVDGLQEHKLLYSNYEDCSIIRITKKGGGLFCDLLLLESAASSDPPTPCKEKFEKYCAGNKIEVYTPDCTT
ncbi:uncharacterized protein LOC115325567 [Ixodes scapularis]|uniref:uncharacterized protein LOC115325567 n=1 Tax=Ixodes scapularis TaxID=6945 RepID=UPI001A9E0AF6|nr:uncharacterized protein LOC115325567 [Ixodes scapularis]